MDGLNSVTFFFICLTFRFKSLSYAALQHLFYKAFERYETLQREPKFTGKFKSF